MTVLHVFDLDGTLLRGSTASVELARTLGLSTELAALEADFRSQAITTREFADEVFTLWGGLTSAHVERAFHGAPWLLGMADVFADIADRGERSMVITMSPNFFADLLSTFGVQEMVASRFPPLPFAEMLDPSGILRAEDKVTIAQEALVRHGIDAENCVAYGDSLSDVPLFNRLSKTVAINADVHLRAMAGVAFDGDDLRPAYALARGKYLSHRDSRARDEPPLR